jgi:hypothetical protein
MEGGLKKLVSVVPQPLHAEAGFVLRAKFSLRLGRGSGRILQKGGNEYGS